MNFDLHVLIYIFFTLQITGLPNKLLVLFAIVVDAVVVVEAAAALVVALRTNNPKSTDGTGKSRNQNQGHPSPCFTKKLKTKKTSHV